MIRAIRRFLRALAVTVASIFVDRLDTLVATFTALDQKLEAFIARQDRYIEQERKLRAASLDRAHGLYSERDRAARIRERVRDIVR